MQSLPLCACFRWVLPRDCRLLVFGTLSFWLREAGVDRSTIGHMSWVGIAFGFKWAWAPLVDRLPIPVLTRFAGPSPQLAHPGAKRHHAGFVHHGFHRSKAGLGARGVVRDCIGFRLRHARHRTGCLPH